MLNVEIDVCIGHILYKLARNAGVVYTGSAGDEPGAVIEMYDFARALGFNVRVVGKGIRYCRDWRRTRGIFRRYQGGPGRRKNSLDRKGSAWRRIAADKVLVSIGRTADLSCLGGMASAIRQDKGRVVVDDYMETSLPGVYAPGDINGKKMLAHAAFKMAETAAANAAAAIGLPAAKGGIKAGLQHIPSVVYCFPEAASVGLTQEEAGQRGPVMTGKFPLAANGRALSADSPEGLVKVLADRKYGEILGVHIAGPGASEIINEAAALMAMEITVHELADIVHGHPTVSEALMEAAADCLGRSIHLPPKKL
jgi:pyruvate/2-oxoglutarate dehydrogenase complex dihydrolipoamide dehydrogenase (E3) component